MPRPQLHDETPALPVVSGQPRARYLVVRREDLWFIKFEGKEYGPYKTDMENMSHAIAFTGIIYIIAAAAMLLVAAVFIGRDSIRNQKDSFVC